MNKRYSLNFLPGGSPSDKEQRTQICGGTCDMHVVQNTQAYKSILNINIYHLVSDVLRFINSTQYIRICKVAVAPMSLPSNMQLGGQILFCCCLDVQVVSCA